MGVASQEDLREEGVIHAPAPRFGKVPEKLMHDSRLTDGAVRLYAHMHWRYGPNQRNFEGRESMAAFLNVSQTTITKRLAELEATDWIAVVPRAEFGTGRKTNVYHIFIKQDDCRKWREANDVAKTAPDLKTRKPRKGIGGKPTHAAKINSSLDMSVNLSSLIDVNLSSHELDSGDYVDPVKDKDTGEAPVAIAPAPAIDLLGLDKPIHSKPLEKAQQAKAIERLGEQPPSKETPKEPSKVPLKVPAPTSEVKNALAILCYGTKDAWALNANKGQLGKVLSEIPGLTVEQLRTFFCNWYAKDWRGKRGDKPKPREVSAEWTILTTTPCSDETAAVLGSVASPSSGPNWIPDPDRPGMFIKPSQLRTRQAEVSHAS